MAPCYNWVNDEGEVTARLNKFVLGKQSSRACGSVNVYYLSSDTTVEFFSRLLCCCCFPPFLCCLPGILAKCIICQRPTSVKMQLWDISLFRRAMLVLNIELLFVILNHFWFFFSVRIWVNGLKMPVISCQVGIENMANNPEGSNNDWTISKKLHRKFASFALWWSRNWSWFSHWDSLGVHCKASMTKVSLHPDSSAVLAVMSSFFLSPSASCSQSEIRVDRKCLPLALHCVYV